MIKASAFTVRHDADGQQTIMARVGEFDLWYRLTAGHQVHLGGESLAAAGLLPAMARGEVLELSPDTPVDPIFLQNLDRVQDVFLAWQGALRLTLRRVRIEAPLRSGEHRPNAGVVSFFSGGVDGTYTAMRHRESITSAVLLRGIDMQLSNEALWTSAQAAAQRLAAHLGLPLLSVESNIRFLGYHYGLKWAHAYQGAGLASIGHLLDAREVLVAATSSLADLVPYGSHPLSDPLWSSAATTIVHEGAVPRTEKIRAISADPVVMEVLRVCWQDAGYNCGRCGKCLRTRLALHLLGVTAPTFSGPLDWSAVGRIRLGDPSEWAFFGALEALERERPDPQARRALAKIRRASLRTSALRDFDASLGGPLAGLKSRLRSRVE